MQSQSQTGPHRPNLTFDYISLLLHRLALFTRKYSSIRTYHKNDFILNLMKRIIKKKIQNWFHQNTVTKTDS